MSRILKQPNGRAVKDAVFSRIKSGSGWIIRPTSFADKFEIATLSISPDAITGSWNFQTAPTFPTATIDTNALTRGQSASTVIEADGATATIQLSSITKSYKVFVKSTYTATGTQIITLSSDIAAISGVSITIKDAGKNAGTNNITVVTEGSETIDGDSSFIISSDNDAYVFTTDGSNWFVS